MQKEFLYDKRGVASAQAQAQAQAYEVLTTNLLGFP